jgi:hypothetical protein
MAWRWKGKNLYSDLLNRVCSATSTCGVLWLWQGLIDDCDEKKISIILHADWLSVLMALGTTCYQSGMAE